MTRQDERALAYAALLRLPDPPELVDRFGGWRGYRVTQPRSPFVDVDLMRRNLATAYVANRNQERGEDISCVVSRRRGGRRELKIVRRA